MFGYSFDFATFFSLKIYLRSTQERQTLDIWCFTNSNKNKKRLVEKHSNISHIKINSKITCGFFRFLIGMRCPSRASVTGEHFYTLHCLTSFLLPAPQIFFFIKNFELKVLLFSRCDLHDSGESNSQSSRSFFRIRNFPRIRNNMQYYL